MEEKEERRWWEELGTLGELLLACAVKRHGNNSWESIAEEVGKRLNHHLSPHFCQQKYRDLILRFNNLQLLSLPDQLRQLRVQELKQQLHRHNSSIATLQLKVKRLKQELSEKELTDPKLSDSVENRFYTESNESNQNNKGKQRQNQEETEWKGEPEEKGEITSQEDRTGLGDKMKNTNREGSSRMKRRRVTRGDELLLVEPGANKRIDVKSQPLIKFLDTLRSHKHGSPFITRLPSQETEKYQQLVRQHMDLDTVEYRFHKGNYNDCHSKFYRDLLLIFTNAVIFYRKSSAEHMAARELRKLLLDEVALRTRKLNDETRPTKPNPDIQHLDPVVKKPRSSSNLSMVACRHRSSGSMQALSDSMKSKRKDDVTHANVSSNGVVTRSKEKDDNVKLVNMERCLSKRRGLKVMSDNVNADGRGRNKNMMKGEAKYSVSEDDKKEDEGRSESEEDEPMETTRKRACVDQKEKGMTTRLNKQGVVNFLKRIKQNSPSSQEKKAEVIKKDANDEDDEDEDEEKEKEKEKEKEEEEEEEEARERERRTKMRNDRNNNDNNSKGKKMKGGNAKRSNTNGDETKEKKATGKNLTNKRLSNTSSLDSVKGGRRSLRSNGDETSRRSRPRSRK